MINKILPLKKYLKTMQYLEDEGLTAKDNSQPHRLLLGVRVVETGDEYYYTLSSIKSYCGSKKQIDTSEYHGKTLELAEHMNKVIRKWDCKPLRGVLQY